MDWVICDEVSEGLRPSEAQVAIKSWRGNREFLRLSATQLRIHDGHRYLAIGIVHQDPETRAYLIEFPHEADSGANRIWVPESSVLLGAPDRVPA